MNRFLKNMKLKGSRVIDMSAYGTEGREGEINITYWVKTEKFPESQIEIWTTRGTSFCIKGDDLTDFLEVFKLLHAIHNGKTTIDPGKTDFASLSLELSDSKRTNEERAGSGTHARIKAETFADRAGDDQGPCD